MDRILDLVELTWKAYKNKVANGLLSPENEKMMQLQLAFILQTLAPLYEYTNQESIKVKLESPLRIQKGVKSIDLQIHHENQKGTLLYPVELTCFRVAT